MRPSIWNYLNQAPNAVAKVLRNTREFMTKDALPGAAGVVVRVDEHELDRARMDRHAVVYCGVKMSSFDPTRDQTRGTSLYKVDVLIHLEGKVPADADVETVRSLFIAVQRAAAVVHGATMREMAGGGKFGGYATNAEPLGGKAQDDEDEASIYAYIDTGVRLWVTLDDDL